MSAQLRRSAVQTVLVVTLGLNLLAAAVKLVAAAVSGSLALTAGGLDSLFDGAANLVGLAAIYVAARPPDRTHPYGHRKFETLVAIAVAAAMLYTCGRLAWNALQDLLAGGSVPEVTAATLAAPLIAFGFNIVASTYEARRGRALASELLIADASHTRADAAVSLALVAGLLAARAGYPLVDPLLALGVAAVIAWAGVRIVRRVSDVLADAAVLDSAEIERRARAVPGVAGVHKVRSRGTADAVALDLHVQVDPALGIGRAHAIGHQVLAELCAAFPQVTDVVVHVEPEWALVDGELARSVRQVVAQFPVEAHEITVHEQDGVGIELDLHLEMDPTFSLADAHQLATRIESAVQARVPALDRIVTHLEPRTGTLEPGALPAVGRDYPALVRAAADQVDGLSNLHDVRVVRVAGGVRLSAHVNAAGSLSLAEAHALVEALEARVRSAAPELERVTIHVEPGEP